MKTICVKCAWHCDCTASRVLRKVQHRCYAPWKKTRDKVTGKMVPAYVDCKHWNNGQCVLFNPKWYVRVWKYLLGVRNEQES